MPSYQITQTKSGVVIGTYPGADEYEALDAMARDAGYRDYRHACSITLVPETEEGIDEMVEKESASLHILKVSD